MTEIQRVAKGKTLNIKADEDCFVMVLPEDKVMPLSKSSAKTRKLAHIGGILPEPIDNPHSKTDTVAKYNGNVYAEANDDKAIDQRAKLAKSKEALK